MLHNTIHFADGRRNSITPWRSWMRWMPKCQTQTMKQKNTCVNFVSLAGLLKLAARKEKAHFYWTVQLSGVMSRALRFGLAERQHATLDKLLQCMRRLVAPVILRQARHKSNTRPTFHQVPLALQTCLLGFIITWCATMYVA